MDAGANQQFGQAAEAAYDRIDPAVSAKQRLTGPQAVALLTLSAAGVMGCLAFADLMAALAYGAIWLVFVTSALLRLMAAHAAMLSPVRLFRRWTGPLPRYTALVALYREETVVADLVAALGRLEYPSDLLEIRFLVEADDPATAAALRACGLPSHMQVIDLPDAGPRTKPKALMIGLGATKGAFVTVFDAEDRPHPRQLLAALDAFAEGGPHLGVVQAPLVIDHPGDGWLTRQFALEYAIQFGQILPLLARWQLPLPLGGTSNHFRRSALEEVGGWDPYNVTEDADLGFRLARAGFGADVIEFATAEEAPTSLRAWLGQRSRWLKGFLQTWLVLMRAPARLWRELGPTGFMAVHATVGLSLLGAALALPVWAYTLWQLVAQGGLSGADLLLAVLGALTLVQAGIAAAITSGGDRGHVLSVLTAPLYWPLATVALLKALAEFIHRPHSWTKTTHGISTRRERPRWH